MLVVVGYDVSTETAAGRTRLRKVAQTCVGFGMRVQYSLFECEVDPAQWVQLRAQLLRIIAPLEDSLRFYHLGSNWERRIEEHGRKKAPDHRGLLEV